MITQAPTRYLCALCGATTTEVAFINGNSGTPFCFSPRWRTSCYAEVAVRREVRRLSGVAA